MKTGMRDAPTGSAKPHNRAAESRRRCTVRRRVDGSALGTMPAVVSTCQVGNTMAPCSDLGCRAFSLYGASVGDPRRGGGCGR
jgi:hypothetical protein